VLAFLLNSLLFLLIGIELRAVLSDLQSASAWRRAAMGAWHRRMSRGLA